MLGSAPPPPPPDLGRFLFLAEELASFPEAPAAQPAEPAEVACDGEEYEEEEAVEAEAEEEAVGSGLPERKASIRAFILAMDEAKLIAVVSSSRGSSGYRPPPRIRLMSKLEVSNHFTKCKNRKL